MVMLGSTPAIDLSSRTCGACKHYLPYTPSGRCRHGVSDEDLSPQNFGPVSQILGLPAKYPSESCEKFEEMPEE